MLMESIQKLLSDCRLLNSEGWKKIIIWLKMPLGIIKHITILNGVDHHILLTQKWFSKKKWQRTIIEEKQSFYGHNVRPNELIYCSDVLNYILDYCIVITKHPV